LSLEARVLAIDKPYNHVIPISRLEYVQRLSLLLTLERSTQEIIAIIGYIETPTACYLRKGFLQATHGGSVPDGKIKYQPTRTNAAKRRAVTLAIEQRRPENRKGRAKSTPTQALGPS
jgi:hypothetical protein